MTYSRVPAAIGYLVAAFTAAAALGQAAPPVSVIDGPKVTADPGPLALWVGVDDIDAVSAGELPAAASSAQQWQGGLGFRNRTEALSVPCVAQAMSGSDDVAVLRDAVDAVMDAVMDVIMADPSLGGLLAGTGGAHVAGGEWRQGPTAQGIAVRVLFSVEATAFISAP